MPITMLLEQNCKLYPEDIDKYIEYKSPIIEEIYADVMRLEKNNG